MTTVTVSVLVVSIFVVSLLLIVLLALVIAALVAVGLEGYYRDRSPRLAKGLTTAARHLSGEGTVPKALDDLLSSHS